MNSNIIDDDKKKNEPIQDPKTDDKKNWQAGQQNKDQSVKQNSVK
jgi:hypothetical protein